MDLVPRGRTETARAVRSRWGALLAAAAAAAVSLVAAAAHAAPQTLVALEYEVAADASGCPDAEEFRAAVARQLGYDPFRPTADKRVGVQIARRDTGFDGRIRWTDTSGRSVGDRHFTSRRSDCREIGASLVFSVAVQIQLLATLAPPATARYRHQHPHHHHHRLLHPRLARQMWSPLPFPRVRTTSLRRACRSPGRPLPTDI